MWRKSLNTSTVKEKPYFWEMKPAMCCRELHRLSTAFVQVPLGSGALFCDPASGAWHCKCDTVRLCLLWRAKWNESRIRVCRSVVRVCPQRGVTFCTESTALQHNCGHAQQLRHLWYAGWGHAWVLPIAWAFFYSETQFPNHFKRKSLKIQSNL